MCIMIFHDKFCGKQKKLQVIALYGKEQQSEEAVWFSLLLIIFLQSFVLTPMGKN